MPTQLIPLNLDLPARLGLNSEAVSGGLDSRWAAKAENCVFDEFGRLCSRKAFKKDTTTPIVGNPTMDTLFEYVKSTSQTFMISVNSDAEIRHGTTTLTDVTGSLSFTDTHFQFANFDGKLVGASQGEDPVHWDGTSNFVTLYSTIPNNYAVSTAYVLGDIVKPVASATTDYYLVCTTAGTTGGAEPTWSAVNGATTTDNTATWTTVTYPKGRCILSAYGRVWILSEDRTTIRYSALGLAYDFSTTNGGGLIDTTAIFGRNDDSVTAIATFNNNLVIFSRFNTLIYSNISDPSNLTIVDQVVGTGCIARDTVENIGNDIIFLSYQGLRSLGRTIQLEKVPLQDLSVNVRNEVIAEVQSNLIGVTNDEAIKSTYSPVDGIYILKLGNYYYVFDFKKSFPSDNDINFIPPRITTWGGGFGADSITLSRDGTIYAAKAGAVGTYSGYSEWGLDTDGTYAENIPYLMTYRSAWTHMGEVSPELANRIKMVKKIYGSFKGGIGYDIDFVLGYDFRDNETRRTKTLAVSNGDQWSLGEWGLAEWSGNTENRNAFANMSGSGERIQLGIDCNIDGAGFCIQTLTVFIKLGRLERGSTKQ